MKPCARTQSRIWLVFGLLAVLSVGACSSASSNEAMRPTDAPTPSSSTSGPGQVGLDASWPVYFANLHEVKQGTDLGVIGNVTEQLETTEDVPRVSGQTIPYTRFLLHITHVLSMSDEHSVAQGDDITVGMTGGLVNGYLEQIDDFPLLEVGQQVALFLVYLPSASAYGIPGPSARFIVRAGVVSTGVDGMPMNPQSVSDFMHDVATA